MKSKIANLITSFAALFNLERQVRRAKYVIRAEKRLKGGGVVPRRFRRSRCWRGRNMGHGHQPSTDRLIRNATRIFRGMAGTTPALLERSRKIRIAKRDHVWKDPRLQHPGAQLAMASCD